MGCCASSASAAPKHPDDKTIDELVMQDVVVEEFNNTFNSVSDLSNMVATLNNNLVNSVDKMKTLASLLLGAYEVDVEVVKNVPKLSYVKDEQKCAFDKIPSPSPELKKSVKDMNDLLVKFATKIEGVEGVSLGKKSWRLIVNNYGSATIQQKGQVTNEVINFNNLLFGIKVELMKLSLKEALDLKKAVKDCIAEMKKQVSEMKPKLDIDMEGLAEGNVDIKLDMGFDTNALFGRPKQIWDALMSEDEDDQGLIPTIIATAKELPTISEKLEEVKGAVEALPKDAGAIKDAMPQDAGMKQTMAAPMNMAKNVAAFGEIPGMVKTLTDNLKDYMNELKDAFG